MKISFHNFCNALMLRRCFLAGCVALFFTSRPITVSAQQLTQADIQAAFVDALKEYATYTTGEDWAIGTLPFGSDSGWEVLADLLISRWGSSGQASVGYSTYALFHDFSTLFLPAFLASTNRAELVQILNAVRVLGSVSNDLSAISTQLSDMDQNNVDKLDYLSGQIADLVLGMQSATTDLGAINTQTYNASLAAGDILGILRNLENPIEVDIRDSGTAANYLGQIIDALLGGSGGSSVVGVLQGLTNSLAGGDTMPVDVQNFDDLAPVLSDFGEELAEKEWDVNVLNFDSSGSDWLTAFESSAFVRSNLLSVAFLASDVRQSASSGSVVAASTPSSISAQNDEDRVVESNSFFSWFTSKVEEPPEMETYETADPPSADYDSTMKPDLLPSSALAPELYHNTRIKLAERGAVAGIQHGDIEIDVFGISGGALGSWVAKLDDIVRAAYYGFLAVASALLFWRYQTKISFVLRDAPRV